MKKIIPLIMVVVLNLFAQKPLMKEFIGINGHYHFKPEVYNQICSQVRNYHNINWDLKVPGDPITLPKAANGVQWDKHLYKLWKDAGFEIDICAQFGTFGEKNKNYKNLWVGQGKWLYDYGYAMAKTFGPSGTGKYCTSIEIGNEPGGDFDDVIYKYIFENMAKGIRAADPKLKIATCTVSAREADDYSKNLDETFSSSEIKTLYDIINVHTYAVKPASKEYSPWDRSYPEDPSLDYMKVLDEIILWKNKNTPEKEVWVTEFGWDCVTPDKMSQRTGWFEKLNWKGVSDLQQAQYIVRSYLCFAEKDITKAFVYYYDDNNQPSVHAASGLTRNGKPKMSYWAVKQLYETLGEFRFNKAVRKDERAYIFEFVSPIKTDTIIWTAWSPTGSGKQTDLLLSNLPGKLIELKQMQTSENTDNSTKIKFTISTQNKLKIKLSETPHYLIFSKNAL